MRQTWMRRMAVVVVGVLWIHAGCADQAGGVGQPAGGPTRDADRPFAMVVLPDTQMYTVKHQEIFHAQMQWIADQAAKENIRFVLHVGDVTNDNLEAQWQVARKAFDRIAGKVPFGIVPGNHDTGPKGNTANREGGLTKHFPLAELKKQPTFGGVYDKEPARADNSWNAFSAGGRKWLVIGLEFAPRNDVLRWANEVVAAHPDHWTIVYTHAYLSQEGRRFDRRIKGQFAPPHAYAVGKSPEGANEGQEMWDKFVSKHGHIKLVISGHVGPAARHEDVGLHGNVVHEMVVDYQTLRNGGDGYLRVLRFSADGSRVAVEDYSPTLSRTYAGAAMTYTLDLTAPASKPAAAK